MRLAAPQIMNVSRNGRVSLPAETRHRWNTDRVLVVDMGNTIVMRPLPDDPIGALRGKYAGSGPTTQEARRQAREEDQEAQDRRLSQ